jgi:MoxR-like ATPase
MAISNSLAVNALPLANLIRAYQALSGATGTVTRDHAVDWLVRHMAATGATLAQIQRAGAGAVTAATNAPAAAQPVTVDAEGIRTMIDQTTALASANGAKLTTLESTLSSALDTVESLGDTVTMLAQRLNAAEDQRIDASTVKPALDQAIADALAPFITTVRQAGMEDRIASAITPYWGTRDAGDLFGVVACDLKGDELGFHVYASPEAPAVDDSYIWTAEMVKVMALAQHGHNVWLGGPKGTGKTQAAMQFAACTGRPFTRINFQKYTSADDFIGCTGLENGATVWKDGAFLQAFERQGSVILLDEITNADPANLAILNGLLEPAGRVMIGGRMRQRAAGVVVIAADNTLATGDDSGLYAGTKTMNASLPERFPLMIACQHLDPQTEIDALVKHTGCRTELATAVVKAIGACRAKVATGDIVDAPSIRAAMAYIRAIPIMGSRMAWNATIAFKQPAESATALEGIRIAYINDSMIESYV